MILALIFLALMLIAVAASGGLPISGGKGRVLVHHMRVLWPGFEPLLPKEQIAPSRRTKRGKPNLNGV
jgi:hypothetical protein